MKWSELYTIDKEPTYNEIKVYIRNPLWDELCEFVENSFQVSPVLSYSKCAAQPGWNIKYRKSSRSICTLYPEDGCFIALVVIGEKEQQAADLAITGCGEYMKNLYQKTPFSLGGKWLMINVTSREILNDLKKVIEVRMKRI